MALQCPECSSENVQRVPMAFESGISTVHSHTKGVGLVGGGLGVGAARTSGVQQSALSKKLTPPMKRKIKGAIILFIIGFIILSGLPGGAKILGLLMMAGGGAMGYLAFQFNKKDYPILLNKWQSSFYCNVCGSIFLPQVIMAGEDNPALPN